MSKLSSEKKAFAQTGKPKHFSPEGRAIHRFYGKKHQSIAAASRRGIKLTEAQRKKIADTTRIAMANLSESSRLRMLHTHLGSHRTEKTKIKQRLYHQSVEGREAGRKGALKTPVAFRNTSIEIKLQNALKIHNIDFLTHVVCENICVPDIQLTNQKIVIFADGCHWHGCPIHLSHCRTVKQRMHRDSFITRFLEKKGWLVFRLWEHEINKDASSCIAKVLQQIRSVDVMSYV